MKKIYFSILIFLLGLTAWAALPHRFDGDAIFGGTVTPKVADGDLGSTSKRWEAWVSLLNMPYTEGAAYFDGSGNLQFLNTVSATELGYLDGVTSPIQTQLDGKEPTITAGTAADYWRGDKTFQVLNTDAVPEATNLYFTDTRARTAAVADAINDGITNIAPSQNAVFDALGLKVPTSRLINTTAPLQGGGDLSADRTLTVDNATEAQAGVVTIAAQKFAGEKTFEDPTVHKERASAPANPAAGYQKIYPKTNGKFYKLTSAGIESELGSGGGGSGGINFVGLNATFEPANTDDVNLETTVGNWLAFKDAAASTPEDLTGGAPTVTCTRTTTGSELVNGVGSLKILKDAADRQGEGCAVIFNVPPGYRTTSNGIRTAKISLPLRIVSGSFTSDDVKIFVYDITNSKIITPAGNTFENGRVEAFFELPLNMAQGRLGIYFASTSPTATTFSTDDAFTGVRDTSAIVNTGGEWIGRVTMAGATNCNYLATSASFTDFAADADCNLSTAIGDVQAPGTKIPGVVIPNVSTRHNYVFKLGGAYMGQNTNGDGCQFRISDGVDTSDSSQLVYISGGSFVNATGQLESSINPTTGGSKTYQVQTRYPFGSKQCTFQISPTLTMQIDVYRFPKKQSVTSDVFEAGDYGWTKFTPGTQGFGTIASDEVFHKRVGDTLFVNGKFTCGTATATEARINLPTGLSVDTNKVPSISVRGSWENSGQLTDPTDTVVTATGGDSFITIGYRNSSQNIETKQNGNQICGSPNRLHFNFNVPIQGWSTFPFGVNAAPHIQAVSFGGAVEGTNVCAADPCTIFRQGKNKNWVTSVSRVSQGVYTVNIASGVFSAPPVCTARTNAITTNRYITGRSGVVPTSTAVGFECKDDAGAVQDCDMNVICYDVN